MKVQVAGALWPTSKLSVIIIFGREPLNDCCVCVCALSLRTASSLRTARRHIWLNDGLLVIGDQRFVWETVWFVWPNALMMVVVVVGGRRGFIDVTREENYWGRAQRGKWAR